MHTVRNKLSYLEERMARAPIGWRETMGKLVRARQLLLAILAIPRLPERAKKSLVEAIELINGILDRSDGD